MKTLSDEKLATLDLSKPCKPLATGDVAGYFGVSDRQVKRWIADASCPLEGFKMGRNRRFSANQILVFERWLQKR